MSIKVDRNDPTSMFEPIIDRIEREMWIHDLSKAEVARRAKVSPGVVTRILDRNYDCRYSNGRRGRGIRDQVGLCQRPKRSFRESGRIAPSGTGTGGEPCCRSCAAVTNSGAPHS